MLGDCRAEEVCLGATVLTIQSGLDDVYTEAVWLLLLRYGSHLLNLFSPVTPLGYRLVAEGTTPALF